MSKRFGHRRISATERLFRKLPDLAKLRQIAYSALVLAIILWAISFQGLVLRVWARDWPQTSAVGLEAKLVSSSTIRGGRVHSLRLSYRYVVDGRTYEGSTFRWLSQRIHPDSFDRYQRQYGAGTRFLVFYDPRNPANAFVLLPDPIDLFMLFFGCISLLVALYHFHEYATTRAIYRIRRPELFEPEQPKPSGPRSARAIKRRQRRSRR